MTATVPLTLFSNLAYRSHMADRIGSILTVKQRTGRGVAVPYRAGILQLLADLARTP